VTWTESLLPYSIENFISGDDADRILALVDRYARDHPDRMTAVATGRSVHVADARSIEETVAMYEPAGRVEIAGDDLPHGIAEIIERAYFAHIEDVRRAYPSASWLHGFAYVEYGPGQYFTPHIDGLTTAQCAGLGVTLSDDFTGGEFCVETCGSNRLWLAEPRGGSSLAPGAEAGSEWFRTLPRTRWSMSPRRGVGVFYGSALVHASMPVVTGRLRKILAFLSRDRGLM
jgi:hypothetical protein